MLLRRLLITLVVSYIGMLSPMVWAAAGDLDTSFGVGGIVTTDISSSDDELAALVHQPDGKILVAGHRYGASWDFALVRYNTDGSLDSSFHGDGKLVTDIGGSDSVTAMALQTDSKILVAGASDNDFVLVRYNSDGSLDSTFDSDGLLTTDINGSTYTAYAMVIQPDGKILVAGYCVTGMGADFALVRFNSDGVLDNTFDSDGKLTTDISGSTDVASVIALQSDSKILVAGYIYTGGSSQDFALVRYNSDGSLDNTFSNDGRDSVDIRGFNDKATAVVVQMDGKILVAGGGSSDATASFDFALVRYNNDGSIDNTFSEDGKLTTSIGTYDYAKAITLLPTGNILLVGASHMGVPTYYDFVLVRYLSDGAIDTTFSDDGILTTDIGVDSLDIAMTALQLGGKILVAGTSDSNFALARYRLTESDHMVHGDTDGDGFGDIATWHTATGDGYQYLMSSNNLRALAPNTGTSFTGLLPSAYTKAAVADFDQNNTQDMLLRNNSNGTWALLEYGIGAPGAIAMNVPMSVDLADAFVAAADINGDGYKDVLLRNTGTGVWSVYFLQGDVVLSSSVIPATLLPEWQMTAVADFNGDNKADLLLRSTTTQAWYLYELDGATVLRASALSMAKTGWNFIGAADFNADGIQDVLLRRASDGAWYEYSFNDYANAGTTRFKSTGSLGLTTLNAAGLAWQVLALADVDDSGSTDIVLYRDSDQTYFLYGMGGVTGRSVVGGTVLPMTTNPAWVYQAMADYNGDGKLDFLLRNTINGKWHLYGFNSYSAGSVWSFYGYATAVSVDPGVQVVR